MAEMNQEDMFSIDPNEFKGDEESELYEISGETEGSPRVAVESQDSAISRKAMTAAATGTPYNEIEAQEASGIDTRPDAMRASQKASGR